MILQNRKRNFTFQKSYWPYCDHGGNFILVQQGNAPATAIKIDRDGSITRLERLSKLDMWPGSGFRLELSTENRRTHFLLHDNTPKRETRYYELFQCDDIENSTVVCLESIDEYTLSPDGRYLAFCNGEPPRSTVCCGSYDTVKGKMLWEIKAFAEKPVWAFCMDQRNDLYVCSSEGVSKLDGRDGSTLWSVPIKLAPAAGATGVRLILGDGLASVSYIDRTAEGRLLRFVLLDMKSGQREDVEPYRLRHRPGIDISDVFTPANASGNFVYRAVTEGRESTIVRLDVQKRKWDVVGYSSIMIPRKLLVCKDGTFIVVNCDSCGGIKVEKIMGEQREIVFSRSKRNLFGFDCMLSTEDQLGIYVEERSKSWFWRIEL